MSKQQRSFVAGRMNKSIDERLLPKGEYVDGQNIRLGSTELTEIGAVENTKGNVQLTTLKYKTVALSSSAVCIGAFDDSAEETMYWFVHDPASPVANVSVVDMIVSFNTKTQQLTYHVITAANTTGPTASLLNFNPTYLINAVDKIDDLLFFTDDYNAPRKINVTRGYTEPNASHVDTITELDISVIKPQPMNSPVLTLQANQANDNFMEDTFLCFAYRYKYKDGEYSATSQFSEPAFVPSDFSVERRSYMNAGMENAINSVSVEFNTGVSNVVGIDVVFKEMDSNVIWVAKKLDKVAQGYQDNSTQSLTFSNGDIYTILSDGEILRLYDNVPRLAKAQTIMANRIMYGNYLEGYDLKDSNDRDIQLTYIAEQESSASDSFVNEEDRSCPTCLFPPPIPPSNPSLGNNYGITGVVRPGYTDRDNEILVDLNAIPVDSLVDGASLSVAVEVRPAAVVTSNPDSFPNISERYYPYVGSPSDEVPVNLRPTTTVEFVYTVVGNHTNVTSAFSGSSWNDQIGTSNNYQQNIMSASSGFTFTDNYNAAVGVQGVPAPAVGYDVLTPIRSAWQNPTGNDSLRIYVDGGFLHVLPNAFNYTTGGPNDNIYMIPTLVSVTVTFEKSGTQQSLHSNRDYQVGIVYQDAEGRQSTALESISNSFHVNAYDSENINWAKITILPSMKPPYWADRYKFVMKQTETDYETIFCTTFYKEIIQTKDTGTPTDTGRAWILLEGENDDKVKEGQDLYVKMDSAGAPDVPITTTVLEVKSMAEGDVAENSPSGVYMKVLPDNFSLDFNSVGSVLTNNQISETTGAGDDNGFPPLLQYPLYSPSTSPPPANTAWAIPAGSRVVIDIHLHRREYDRMGEDYCGRETCNFKFDGRAGQAYNNLWEFWMGEGLNISQNSDCDFPFGDDSGPNEQIFYDDVYDYAGSTPFTQHGTLFPTQEKNKYQFTTNSTTGEFWFEIQSGTRQCPSTFPRLRKESKSECTIAIYPATVHAAFETLPTTTAGEIYYENDESFAITGGYHLSGSKDGDVNQSASVSGVVNLGFFNCYTFFNGIESYRIRDSITGKKIYLGNRVTAVSEQDYKAARRGSSITYSGVYNEQNNVNKLNDFNLGLANYKDCEESYGPIQVLHSRTVNILTLQEDRISYVGVNTNVLTDAVGGGILTSVPQILGTQSTRIEEYGISENPESFCQYGKDVYFTDAKRNAVIQLKGGEGTDALTVVSNVGMRSWFRDLFQTSFNRQKLGGYDPYMNEYVLSPNTNKLPFEVPVYGCGGNEMQFTGLLEPEVFAIDFGSTFGNVTISGNASVSTTISVLYNGVTTTTGAITGAFSLVFDKDVPSVTQATVTITPNAPATDSVTLVNSIACPIADFIRIIPIVITSADDIGRTRTQEFQFNDNTVGYTSPLWQDFHLTFLVQNASYSSSNIVSRFGPQINGYQGTGMIPMDNADVYMRSRKIKPNDTFNYNLSANKMRYWRTSGTYSNNAADIATILTNSTPLTNTGPAGNVVGTFTMPASTPPPALADQFLYLVWDYREVNALKLCFSAVLSEACCECFSAPDCVPFLGSAISTVDSATACGLAATTNTYYTSTITTGGVANTIPIIGTTVYPSTGCSSETNRRLLQAGYIHFIDAGVDKWVQIDSDNIVIASGNC